MGALRRRDHGSAGILIGLLVALLVFSAAAVTMGRVTHEMSAGTSANADAPDLQSRADNALHLIVTNEGRTSAGAPTWDKTPDTLTRFGLADPAGANRLALDKVQILTKGTLATNVTNGFPDYDEVRNATDLNAYQFHLRAYPLLVGLGSGQFVPYDISMAYVGHYELENVDLDGSVQYTTWNTTGYAQVNVTVTNTGTGDNVYQVQATLRMTSPGKDVRRDGYSLHLWPGGTDEVKIRYYDMDWANHASQNGDYTLRVKVMGVSGSAYEDDDFVLPLEKGANTYNLKAYPGGTSYEPGDKMTVYADSFNKNGDRVAVNDVLLEVLYPNGTVWQSDADVDIPSNKAEKREWTLSASAPDGNYTIRTTKGAFVLENRVTVETDDIPGGDNKVYVESNASKIERRLLDDLTLNFTNVTYYTDTSGDVYRDVKDDADSLVGVMSAYDTIVVGTEVSHNAMNDPGFRQSIGTWVNDTGGTLIVLGSANQNSEWLENLYDTGLKTAGGGVSAPDPTHPLLHTPEELAYFNYLDFDYAWLVKTKVVDLFTSVLLKSTGPQGVYAKLAVSKPGALGNGTLILTAYTPGNLTDPQDMDEARRLLHNLVVHSYNMIFLDFGPEIPANALVATATRLVAVPNPINQDPLLHLRLVIYVWR
ncbi:MAG: COG1470 family protein [Methanobacteriota archaeon]